MKNKINNPLITIITVVYNDVTYIEDTIKSVINQTYPNVEYIIIDGGSTDGTIGIIKKYEKYIDYWISEKDKGIYDAMNKGIDLANGMWLNFMNSGDRFYDTNVLKNIFSTYYHKNLGIIYGKHAVKYNNKKNLLIKKIGNIKNIWKGSQFSHQSAFIKTLYHKNNKFNICNKIVADFEFFYNAYIKKIIFKKIPYVIAVVSTGGISDKKRIDSIVGRWNIVEKNNIVNIYYIYKIVLEMIKESIKKCLKRR